MSRTEGALLEMVAGTDWVVYPAALTTSVYWPGRAQARPPAIDIESVHPDVVVHSAMRSARTVRKEEAVAAKVRIRVVDKQVGQRRHADLGRDRRSAAASDVARQRDRALEERPRQRPHTLQHRPHEEGGTRTPGRSRQCRRPPARACVCARPLPRPRSGRARRTAGTRSRSPPGRRTSSPWRSSTPGAARPRRAAGRRSWHTRQAPRPPAIAIHRFTG